MAPCLTWSRSLPEKISFGNGIMRTPAAGISCRRGTAESDTLTLIGLLTRELQSNQSSPGWDSIQGTLPLLAETSKASPEYETLLLLIESVITKGGLLTIWLWYAGRGKEEQLDLLFCAEGLGQSHCATCYVIPLSCTFVQAGTESLGIDLLRRAESISLQWRRKDTIPFRGQ